MEKYSVNNKDEFLKEARERLRDSMAAEQDNRDISLQNIKFEHGEQWTDQELSERAGRITVKDNRVAGAVKLILGDARMNRPSIKVRPVDSESDPLIAEIYTGIIRNIENVSDAESVYDNGHDNAVRGGFGYWRVTTEYADEDTFDQDIWIRRIVNPHNVYFDQESIEATYEDAQYCFVSENMSKERFEEKYPDAEITDWEGGGVGESLDDWFAADTVRVAEYWYKEPYTKWLYKLDDNSVVEVKKPKETQVENEGRYVMDEGAEEVSLPRLFKGKRKVECQRIMQCIISGNDVLEGPTEWPGKYIPIIPCLGEEIWIEGRRILRSAIYHAVDAQKILNWNVSNDLEIKSMSPKQPFIVAEGQIEGYRHLWDKAYSTPLPYLPYKPVPGTAPPNRLTGSAPDVGATQGIMMAIDSVKAATGIFDASLGARSNEQSGIAIERRQRQGSMATYVFTDNQSRAIKFTGRILVDLIPKVYDGERVLRLLGENLNKSFAGQQIPTGSDGRPLINVEQGGQEAQAKVNVTDPMSPPDKPRYLNDLTIGKYDIVIDVGAGYMTRRQEAAEGMIELSRAYPATMPVLVPRIAKNLDWPDADDIGEELKQIFMPPPPPGPSPKDQMDLAKGQLDLQKGQADLEGKQIDNQVKMSKAQIEQVTNARQMQQIARQVVIQILRDLNIVPGSNR